LAAEIVQQIYGYQIFTTYQFVEILPSAQQVLRSHYPLIPIHSDIKTYTPPQNIDAYFISFPCTGTSQAGTKTGLNHPESNLWFEALRCICIGKPKFVVIEQPEGFIHRGLRACLGGLRMAGYSTEVELSRHRSLAHLTDETESLLLPTPTTYPCSNGKGGNAGMNKLEWTLKQQGRLESDSEALLQAVRKLSILASLWKMGFPDGYLDCLIQGGGKTITPH
jgi:hypothetical protein